MLADQTVLRRAVAVRRQMVANRCRTCCDVSRWGSAGDATAYELRRPPEHMHQRDDPFVIGAFREAREYDGFQQGSCIDRARRAWRLRIRNGWHGRRRGNIGRSGCLRCFGCFDRAGCFGRFVRSIRPLYAGRLVAFQYIVPQQGGESSHRQIEHISAVGARSRAYRSENHTDQPSSTRKHGHGHVHRHALGIGQRRDRSTRVPTHASRSVRRNRTRRSPAAYDVRSCSPAT